MLSRFRHDLKRSLQCIVPISGTGAKPSRRLFFLGSLSKEGAPIKLNGNIAITCAILKLVAASATEAELGALFLNVQEASILRLFLLEMGHPQPKTPVHVDNTTGVGIVNNTIKRQRSHAMEMRYFWPLDQTTQRYINVYYQPGAGNMGDYPSKAHTGHIHKHVRPYYVQTNNSPRELPRAEGQAHGEDVLKHLGIPTTRESHFHMFQNTVTLAKTSN